MGLKEFLVSCAADLPGIEYGKNEPKWMKNQPLD